MHHRSEEFLSTDLFAGLSVPRCQTLGAYSNACTYYSFVGDIRQRHTRVLMEWNYSGQFVTRADVARLLPGGISLHNR